MQYVHIMEGTMMLLIQVSEQSTVVQDHYIFHTTHFLMLIEVWPLCNIIIMFANFNESPINEFNTTFKLEDVCTKGCVHYSTIGLWNFIANDITNLDEMKITSSHIALLLQSHRNASYMIPLSCIMYMIN